MLATVLVALVALVHVVISLVEMLLWKRPAVHERLDFKEPEALKVANIVANAGLYNAFLAAGLIWGAISGPSGDPIRIFFLTCVIIAGVFGAVTLRPTTLLLQTAPGVVALIAVMMSRSSR